VSRGRAGGLPSAPALLQWAVGEWPATLGRVHDAWVGCPGFDIIREHHADKERSMSTDDILAKIRGILVEQLDVKPDDVKLEASFADDLDADSLALVELIMELEDQFGIKISDEEAEKIKTVGDAVDFVAARV
jgi:acyl carrier protein